MKQEGKLRSAFDSVNRLFEKRVGMDPEYQASMICILVADSFA